MRAMMMGMAALAALTAAQPANADTVSDWWEFSSRIAPYMAPGGTPEQGRALTRASLAMFEAVNAIDRRYESYLGFPAGDPAASQDAAAATAAYTVMLHHFPAQKTALDDSYAIAMSAIAEGPAREAGRLIGEQAARAAIAAGGIDPALQATPYRPRTTPGVWVSTQLPQIETYMVTYRPWVLTSADAVRPPPPPALTSERWARDYEEVRLLGGRTSAARTPHQTLMARYRQAFDLTPSLRLAADAPGRTPVQNARMFALYQMAFDDAVLAMADAKAHYDFWRPITAIRNGADDGNDATAPDAGWTPLLGTPNFAEYPCGHCVVAAAHAEVMKAEVGPRPPGGVRVGSLAVPMSAVQVLPGWDDWVRDVSDSRIYGGVHFRFSNEAGEQIGRDTARRVLERVMRPLP
ncbi:vanadium-dependent haloperoxidase [Brevundimonas sp.]|uniref:vanadium-dependent haloperoxidase n=1 Tax=Brevundimonas sp. TaxID=1871086 RepID=UPI002EDA1AA1